MAPREADGYLPTDLAPAAPVAPVRAPVERVLAGFAQYLLGEGAVDPAEIATRVADLDLAGCVEFAADLQRVLARTQYLQDRVCAEAVRAADAAAETSRAARQRTRTATGPDAAGARTRFAGRFTRSACVAELATACALSERGIWWRIHRCTDLAEAFPANQAAAASGRLDPARIDSLRRRTERLGPGGRHRLDEIVAGRPDPLTPEDRMPTPTEPLRPLGPNEWATPRRFDAAIRRRAKQIKNEAIRAGDRHRHRHDTNTTNTDNSSNTDNPDSTPDAGTAPCGLRDRTTWSSFTHLEHGEDGQGYLTLGGAITSLLVIKAVLDAAERAGHNPIDVTESWATHAAAGLTPNPTPSPSPTSPSPTSPSPTTNPSPTSTGGTGGTGGRGGGLTRPVFTVIVPLAALTGASVIPAHLPGYGEFPLRLLKDLWSTATLRCGVVAQDGTLIALTRDAHPNRTTAYTPPDRVRRFITLAWQHCAFPGCDVPADRCQLDHTEPHPAGATCECNLRPLCGLHHNLRTHGGWTYTATTISHHSDLPLGTLTWTSPHGATYHTQPALPEVTNTPR